MALLKKNEISWYKKHLPSVQIVTELLFVLSSGFEGVEKPILHVSVTSSASSAGWCRYTTELPKITEQLSDVEFRGIRSVLSKTWFPSPLSLYHVTGVVPRLWLTLAVQARSTLPPDVEYTSQWSRGLLDQRRPPLMIICRGTADKGRRKKKII